MGKGAAIKTALTYIKEMNLVQRMSIFTKILQKHETIGFKEYVRKSTSRIQEKPIKQTIDNILSNAAKSRMSAMTAEYNKLILETKGAL